MADEKTSKDKPTEKTERIAVYFTKDQKARLDKYAQKIGQSAADSVTCRSIIMQFLDIQNIH